MWLVRLLRKKSNAMPTHIYTPIDIMKRKKNNTVGKNIAQHWRIKGYNQENCKNDDVLLCV